MEIIQPRQPWQPIPEDSGKTCNRSRIGWALDAPGDCDKPAAYELELPGFFTLRNCLEHHKEYLRDQEKTGKIQWLERELPGGAIELKPHDPYADPPHAKTRIFALNEERPEEPFWELIEDENHPLVTLIQKDEAEDCKCLLRMGPLPFAWSIGRFFIFLKTENGMAWREVSHLVEYDAEKGLAQCPDRIRCRYEAMK